MNTFYVLYANLWIDLLGTFQIIFSELDLFGFISIFFNGLFLFCLVWDVVLPKGHTFTVCCVFVWILLIFRCQKSLHIDFLTANWIVAFEIRRVVVYLELFWALGSECFIIVFSRKVPTGPMELSKLVLLDHRVFSLADFSTCFLCVFQLNIFYLWRSNPQREQLDAFILFSFRHRLWCLIGRFPRVRVPCVFFFNFLQVLFWHGNFV